jgi:hypothetical protein
MKQCVLDLSLGAAEVGPPSRIDNFPLDCEHARELGAG